MSESTPSEPEGPVGWVSAQAWEGAQERIRDLNKWRRSVREACIERGVAYDADDASATVARLASSAEPTKPHWQRTCQEGGELCAAGQRDGVVCPEESCDIDDGLRGLASSLPAPTDAWMIRAKELLHECETEPDLAIKDAIREGIEAHVRALVHEAKAPLAQPEAAVEGQTQRATELPRYEVQCWGCEGFPSGDNDPCEVCGRRSRKQGGTP